MSQELIESLQAANEAFGKRQEWWNEKMLKLEQERDALAAKLVPLTDEQADEIALDVMGFAVLDKEQNETALMLIRATEAAHKIGGQQ